MCLLTKQKVAESGATGFKFHSKQGRPFFLCSALPLAVLTPFSGSSWWPLQALCSDLLAKDGDYSSPAFQPVLWHSLFKKAKIKTEIHSGWISTNHMLILEPIIVQKDLMHWLAGIWERSQPKALRVGKGRQGLLLGNYAKTLNVFMLTCTSVGKAQRGIWLALFLSVSVSFSPLSPPSFFFLLSFPISFFPACATLLFCKRCT